MLLQISEVRKENVQAAVPPKLEGVLRKFSGVFEEPKGLPPKRNCDNCITLKEGTTPISMRSY